MKYQRYTITYFINNVLLRVYTKELTKALAIAKALEVKYNTTTNIVRNF